jgi:DNA-directed RNA polymerase specialized sigma24 family protein
MRVRRLFLSAIELSAIQSACSRPIVGRSFTNDRPLAGGLFYESSPMQSTKQTENERLKQEFLELLPDIERYARHVFRRCRDSDREELIAETTARVWLWFVRLSARGKEPSAVFRPLLRFAVLAVKDGRRVGARKNGRELCHRAKCDGRRIFSLEERDDRSGSPWKAIVAEARAFSPADAAAARLDIEAWLRCETVRKRAVANALAVGERPSAIAARLRVSCGRISQLRHDLRQSWERFQGSVEDRQRRVVAATCL